MACGVLLAIGYVAVLGVLGDNRAQGGNVPGAEIDQGRRLYETSCITCHGDNLQGVTGRGPALIGVGQAAVYFQVSTGRMPASANGAQPKRKPPVFSDAEIDALAAYVQANGGGPVIPQGDLAVRSDIAHGGDLFRLNCASCHNFTGEGGALSNGSYAPALDPSTDRQIYGAMLTGPQNMPTFSDAQLSPEEKGAIIAYIQSYKSTVDPGGYPAGGYGPVPEGLLAFLIGMGAIVASVLWLGSRA